MPVNDPVIAEQTPAADFTIEQKWDRYSAEEHAIWTTLYERQMKILGNRAVPEFFKGLELLNLNEGGIPDFRRVNEKLEALTGWTVVTVPGLIPEKEFFEHLANRRFVSGRFIRDGEKLDYLPEPDIFHDVFGHVPLLSLPVFADYMAAYGRGGLRSIGFDAIEQITRLYWYTVEFGLINTPEGRRIYGAGIVSSRAESIFSLEARSPNRIHFDIERIMRTDYRYDDFQQSYFVIDSFEELMEATYQDFESIYQRLRGQPDLKPSQIIEGDRVYSEGSQEYARAGGLLKQAAAL
ncbi:phenylalanine 4-monooxygenase [uncultured Maricaulis sp.]|uniref:phenylalanine 4-monooxygenase n=1 Tax=uncultured Maricaulis sp. TaxID=174710 RepID=UPI0030D86D18|tara:strand:+ start:36614 stop:37495 length:882 start_codon:yes stop_codon:yes gene_type:complete